MKTLARVMMILMLAVSFTGFGQTTSDLAQNSDPTEVDIGIDNVEIVDVQSLTLEGSLSIAIGDPEDLQTGEVTPFVSVDPECVDMQALLSQLKERRHQLTRKPRYNETNYRETDFKLISLCTNKVPETIPKRE